MVLYPDIATCANNKSSFFSVILMKPEHFPASISVKYPFVLLKNFDKSISSPDNCNMLKSNTGSHDGNGIIYQ